MKRLASLLTVGACLLLAGAAKVPGQDSATPDPDPQALVGSWRVDLRPTPDAEPYYQQFEVLAVENGVLSGTFYGSQTREGRVNVDWGAVHFAFVTKDGSGRYNSSGVLRDGRIEGRTHALGRGFLSVWTAVPVDVGEPSAD